MSNKRYKVIGHYPTMCNGEISYVIVEFSVESKEEAEKEVEKRKRIYHNLVIIKE